MTVVTSVNQRDVIKPVAWIVASSPVGRATIQAIGFMTSPVAPSPVARSRPSRFPSRPRCTNSLFAGADRAHGASGAVSMAAYVCRGRGVRPRLRVRMVGFGRVYRQEIRSFRVIGCTAIHSIPVSEIFQSPFQRYVCVRVVCRD